jgi:hypothetical protein
VGEKSADQLLERKKMYLQITEHMKQWSRNYLEKIADKNIIIWISIRIKKNCRSETEKNLQIDNTAT